LASQGPAGGAAGRLAADQALRATARDEAPSERSARGGVSVVGSSFAALRRGRPRPIRIPLLAADQVVRPILLESGEVELAGPLVVVQIGRLLARCRVVGFRA
jgi:hypothetical protein